MRRLAELLEVRMARHSESRYCSPEDRTQTAALEALAVVAYRVIAALECPLWVISGHLERRLAMSASPPRADMLIVGSNVRNGSLADITARSRHVRFTIKADIHQRGLHVRFVPIAEVNSGCTAPLA